MSSPCEGLHAGEHLVEHEPEREDVGAMVERLAHDLLGRHVLRRAQQDAGLRLHRRLVQARDAEVHDLHAPVGEHHDVAGLHVAVHDAALVRDRERLRRPRRRSRPRCDGVRLASRISSRRSRALEQLHRDEGDVALAAHVVDRDDRRVAEAARGARLLQEARLVQVALLRRRR